MKQILINTLKATFLLCAVVSFFTRCEDKGNYDYLEVSSVDSLNDIDANYTYALGDTLRITPRLVFKQETGTEADFEFTWYKQRSAADYQVIQEGRNLVIAIDTPFFQRNNSYTLLYEAKNTTTQVAFRKTFGVNVVNTFQRGYVALCQKEGEMEIDLLSLNSTEDFVLYTDILRETGSALPRTGVTPWDVLTFEDPTAPNPYALSGDYSMYILTDQYTTRILPRDYSWKESYDISNMIEKSSHLDTAFVQKGLPVIAKKMQYSFLNIAGAVFPRVFIYHEEAGGEQGNWYMYNTNPMLLQFAVQMNRVRPAGTVRYEPAPFIAAANQGALFFDRTAGKFMYASAPANGTYGTPSYYYSEAVYHASEPKFNGAAFSDANEGVLYMGDYPSNFSSANGYAIVKMPGGDFRYLQFTYQTNAMGMIGGGKKAVSAIATSSNIGNAKFFAREPNTSFLYYVTHDNKVYKADVSVNPASVEDITATFLTGDGYDEITLFKFTNPQSYGVPDNLHQTLSVGTYNAGLGLSEGGKLTFYRLASTSSGNWAVAKYPHDVKDLQEGKTQVTMSWTGLGKIVGLTYKRR